MKNLVINRAAVRANLKAAKTHSGNSIIIADLSSDCCGMGMLEMARLLRDDGVRAFAVSEAKDAAALRRDGFVDERIMMLRGTADHNELARLCDLGVVCAVTSHDDAVVLSGIAEDRHTICEVQIMVDTGYGGYGFLPDETDKILSVFKYMPSLAVVGMFSLMPDAWHGAKKAQAQIDALSAVAGSITQAGYRPGILHVSSDGALFAGLPCLDGIHINRCLTGSIPGLRIKELQSACAICATVEEISWQPKGSTVMGKRLSAAKKTAVVPVGWFDGLGRLPMDELRTFQGKLKALTASRTGRTGAGSARIMGKPAMDFTVLDITGVSCSIGSEVLFDADPTCTVGLNKIYR